MRFITEMFVNLIMEDALNCRRRRFYLACKKLMSSLLIASFYVYGVYE